MTTANTYRQAAKAAREHALRLALVHDTTPEAALFAAAADLCERMAAGKLTEISEPCRHDNTRWTDASHTEIYCLDCGKDPI